MSARLEQRTCVLVVSGLSWLSPCIPLKDAHHELDCTICRFFLSSTKMEVLRGGTTAHLLQIKLPPWSAAFLVVVVVVVAVVVVAVEASVPRAPF